MAGIEVRQTIAAPIAEVFARATDFAAAAETIRAITKVEILTQGPVGVGTRFRETRLVFGREATEEMEITSFEPPRRYTLGCENHGCRYHSEIGFEENGSGTEVTMTFEATPLTLIAKIMMLLTKPMMKKMAKEVTKDLDDLKTAIEERPD